MFCKANLNCIARTGLGSDLVPRGIMAICLEFSGREQEQCVSNSRDYVMEWEEKRKRRLTISTINDCPIEHRHLGLTQS